eukprot:31505-Pelagococcus_subviridis.AAC.3
MRREKSLRSGVHRADAVVRGPAYRTRLTPYHREGFLRARRRRVPVHSRGERAGEYDADARAAGGVEVRPEE